jgi:uncharacterized integral membrane protein
MSWKPPDGPEGPRTDDTAALLRRYGPAGVIALLAVIFIGQNLDNVDVEFLWLDFGMPLWLMLVVFGGIGALVFWGVDRRRRSRRAKNAD